MEIKLTVEPSYMVKIGDDGRTLQKETEGSVNETKRIQRKRLRETRDGRNG